MISFGNIKHLMTKNEPGQRAPNSMQQRLHTIITIILLLPFCFSYGQTRSSLKEQAQTFVSRLKNNDDYPMGGRDTLIDLNGDNLKDILIEFYALAGTGEKNGIRVYLYDNSKKKFKPCEPLNYLANPTFYFDKKVVVGYYLGNGSGQATTLKWHGLKLDTLEHIDIDITWHDNDASFKLVSYNYITKKNAVKTVHAMDLPKEYKYMDYEPIIKTNSP